MNTSSIKILKAMADGTEDQTTLQELAGVKNWQFNSLIKDLIEQGYVIKDENKIKFQEGIKAIIFRDIAKRWDIEKLLYESNEIIISYLTEPIALNAIENISGLSRATVYRSISDLESIGAIEKENDIISLNQSDEKLVLFAQTLKTERERKHSVGDAEVLYQDASRVLKKVPKGKTSEGVSTAFSLFSDYGIEYHTVSDYYIKQENSIKIEDVLIHSILASKISKDKMGLIMSIVFYLKNKEKMDTLTLREVASLYNVEDIWVDIEGYLRGNEIKNSELFLPWKEFVEKAELYEIPSDKYTLPSAYPTFFEDIGKQLPREIKLYLLGGENMRMKGLKPRTKDCDVIVENEDDFNALVTTLKKLGYEPIAKTEFSQEDWRIYPVEILVHSKSRSRIDLFTKKVMKDLSLSSKMKETTDFIDYGNAKVGLLRNEYVFLLKAVTSREGDIHDMSILVQKTSTLPRKFYHGKFDWDLVWEELIQQDQINYSRNIAEVVLENLDLLTEKTDIKPPFYEKLERRVVDVQIRRQVRGGKSLLRNIVDNLKGENVQEGMIRNRIDALVKEGIFLKQAVGYQVVVLPVSSERFPEKNWEINAITLETYLKWRFPLREESTPPVIEKLSKELKSFGIETIRELDEIVIQALDVLIEYERIHFTERHFKNVGTTRICVRLAKPEIGNRNSYHVIEFERFSKMLERIKRADNNLKVNA